MQMGVVTMFGCSGGCVRRSLNMASVSDGKKSFWKRGNGPKLPGRPQPVTSATNEQRYRSKTFEEFEKDTEDVWDDEPGDIKHLSSDAKLEFEHSGSNKKTGQKLKNLLVDAVKPRSSSTSSVNKSKTVDGNNRVRSHTEFDRGDHSVQDPFDMPDRETAKLQKFGKLLAGPNTDLDMLKKHSWSGIPTSVRSTTWQLLCGYLPANIDRREETLKRKREEYMNFIEQYYSTKSDPLHRDTYRQIHIDVPRMNPDIPLFQQSLVQECFERILFIWSIRHPASGYVQGINDLLTPFFVVFLSYYISGDKNPETFDLSLLPESTRNMIEADSFWCLQKLLEGIQDNYTLAQPGIQTKVKALKDLISRIDLSLDQHLKCLSIDFLQFSFRWMNNLLMRELPLCCVIRLWDAYLSEPDGFAWLHVYVCAALLVHFSKMIRARKDFQETMLFIQNLPTSDWSDDDVQMLLAEAFKLKYMFADAPGHLQSR